MIYSDIEYQRLHKILENKREHTVEEELKYNILKFIKMIHDNDMDFIDASFDDKYYGALTIVFRKCSGQVAGLITASYEDERYMFIFNEEGYEPLETLLEMA